MFIQKNRQINHNSNPLLVWGGEQTDSRNNCVKVFLLYLSCFLLISGIFDAQAKGTDRVQLTVANPILKADLSAQYLKQFSLQARQALSREIFAAEFDGTISAALVAKLLGMKEIADIQDLMIKLLPLASEFALPPISNFRVGAISQGKSGALYLGANLEIVASALGFTVHAEQSAINNALLHGDAGVKRIAVTAPPCGHCRQFLNELNNAAELEIIVINHNPVSLSRLLPESFGPTDLGVKNALFSAINSPLQCPLKEDVAVCLGVEVAQYSYSPYSYSSSSIMLKVKDELFAGTYIENAAFNPSLSPLLSALDRLRFRYTDFNDIREVILIEMSEARISQASYTKAIINTIAPSAIFRVVKIKATEEE